ncbi:hypothetical protein [Candidatus Magnetaquicoccus inordinatus]|uniref:hypothetical protein n=1 Tax=Candidatus Magnetaquicoccus inordinatus TaxID=2496818 RepID=UPI00102C86CB|nr:hypothetical protein [Candidatus Magnetaquicoccus inordinatus]MBF0184937.1 hypothetical protein [Magnetococcales bacterium]
MSEPTILELFVQESQRRILQGLDDVRKLSTREPSARTPVLEAFLRTCRGIRGTAGFHDLDGVVRLSQALERLLEGLLEDQALLDTVTIASLERGMSRLQGLFGDVSASNEVRIDDVIGDIEEKLTAWSQPVPVSFDLRHYPREVAEALVQQLQFYRLEVPLAGTWSAKRDSFNHLKETVSTVGTIVDIVPKLGEDLEIGEQFVGKSLHLLLATVLQPDLLAALTQLSAHQVQHLPVPEEMVGTGSVPAEQDVFEEGRLGELEEKFRQEAILELQSGAVESDEELRGIPVEEPLSATQPADGEEQEEEPFLLAGLEMVPTDESAQSEQPGVPEELIPEASQDLEVPTEEPIRLVLDSMEWDQLAETSSLPESAELLPDEWKEEPQANEEPVRRRRPWLVVGAAMAAGICVLLYLNWPKSPAEKVPEPAAPVAQSTPPLSAPGPLSPVSPQAERLPEKTATKSDPTIAPDSVLQEPPAQKMEKQVSSALDSKASKAIPDASKPASEELVSKAVSAALPAEGVAAHTAEKVSPSVSSRPRTKPGLEPYAQELVAIDRLRHAPYLKLVPPKGKSQNTILFDRHAEGGIVFSVASLLGHTAKRPGEEFVLQPDTIKDLRMVFQIDLGEAYLFSFDASGQLYLPADFWNNFYRYSRRAVTLSRVVKTGSKGLQIRDIMAISAELISRHAGKDKSTD